VSRYDGCDSTEGFEAALTFTDTLAHLPGSKRRAADHLSRGQAVRSTNLSARKAGGKILKIMPYGCYARGDWIAQSPPASSFCLAPMSRRLIAEICNQRRGMAGSSSA
jgi:hypothetical protein